MIKFCDKNNDYSDGEERNLQEAIIRKGKLLEAIIIHSDPDIIIASETWLDKSIASSEILLNDLSSDIKWRDRQQDPIWRSFDGFKMGPCGWDLQLRNIHCGEIIELISGTVTVEENKTICITSYYRPPNRTDEAHIDKTRQ